LDSLTETFRLGLEPKGSSDPLGLRRAANGMVSTLLAANIACDISDIFEQPKLQEFVEARMKAQFLEEFGGDVVNAVFACSDNSPVGLYHRCLALHQLATSDDFSELRATFKRLMGLTKDQSSMEYNPTKFVDDSERNLHKDFLVVKEEIQPLLAKQDFTQTLAKLVSLKASIDHLFDSVMVMDPDPDIKKNRLGLLRSISAQFLNIADFTFIN